MTVTIHSVTAEELLRIPDDSFRYELVRGELRKMAPAGQKHGRTILNLTTPLDQHVRANGLGVVFAAETGFRIASNPDTVRAPDVAFVRKERVDAVGDVEGFWPGAPDLAVEVVSPHDSYARVEEKVFDWLKAGCRMVIVLNPDQRTASIYRSLSDIRVLTESDTLSGEDIIPGWSIPVSKLFE